MMDSGMISKIEKAMLYARERGRVRFNQFTVTFAGDHETHTVSYVDGTWDCTCEYFQSHRICSHVMALERILDESVIPAKMAAGQTYSNSGAISKIEKAMMYASEKERITFETFDATFEGDHEIHNLSYDAGVWSCDCAYFQSHRICSHVMAMERILDGCVKPAETRPVPA